MNLSLTQAEFDGVDARARRHGLSLVDYGRWLIVDGGKSGALPVPPEGRFDRLAVLQLQRLGNLLNQIVRQAHTHGYVPADELVALLRDIRAMLK